MDYKAKGKCDDTMSPIVKRLDALIRLALQAQHPHKNKGLTETSGARILRSVGLTPTEIAKILGKKSATEIAPYLYQKKERKL